VRTLAEVNAQGARSVCVRSCGLTSESPGTVLATHAVSASLVDQLRAWVRREILFADDSAEDARAFAQMSRERSHRVAFQLWLTVIVTTLVAWPLDLVLFAPDAVQRRVSPQWRLALLALTVPIALLHHKTPRVLPGNPWWIGLLAKATATIPAWGLSRSGGIEHPAFGALYLVSFTTVPMTVPIGARVVVTLAVPAAMLTRFFACNPAHPLVGTVFSVTSTVVLCLIAVGHVYATLSRKLFAQNRALDQRARDFQELDRVRRDLFANLSHEFRTPLPLIRGAFHQLDRASADPAVRAAIAPGLRNTDQLLHLVEDLLELARFDAGRRAPDRRAMDLACLVREVAGNVPLRLGHELRLRGCDEPVPLNADPRQLRMVLNNLLGNAQKFIPPADHEPGLPRGHLRHRHRARRVLLLGPRGLALLVHVQHVPRRRLHRVHLRPRHLGHHPRRAQRGPSLGQRLHRGHLRAPLRAGHHDPCGPRPARPLHRRLQRQRRRRRLLRRRLAAVALRLPPPLPLGVASDRRWPDARDPG
jgi:signal transduction histidine kinase